MSFENNSFSLNHPKLQNQVPNPTQTQASRKACKYSWILAKEQHNLIRQAALYLLRLHMRVAKPSSTEQKRGFKKIKLKFIGAANNQ